MVGVLNRAREMLHGIWMAPSRAEASQAFDLFLKTCKGKYAKATDCVTPC